MKNFNIAIQIQKNFVKSAVLIILLAAGIVGVGALLGYFWGDIWYGVVIAGIVALIAIPIQLATAKSSLLRMTRGTSADPLKHRQLLEIVADLSQKAGLKKVPPVYITDASVPNAFASGMSEKSAFLGVTQGLLDTMNEDELRGVLAHEVGHIVHRDILLNALSVAMISVILILSTMVARVGLFGGRRRSGSDKNGSGILVIVLVLLSILARPIAYLITSLIQMAISRKREYAADAYSAKLLGSGIPLSNALIKIGGVRYDREDKEDLGGNSFKAMYIDFPGDAKAIFSTHPPIEERIRILREIG